MVVMIAHSPSESTFQRLRETLTRAQSREVRLGCAESLGGILLVTAILRFAFLGQHSIWFDEAFVARIASHVPWAQIFPLLKGTDAHPPLYYLFMKLWVGVFGTTETALRVPSAVFSTLSVLATFLLARRILGTHASLLASLFVALSPFAIVAGQEARMYPLLQLLALLSTLALLSSVESGGVLRWTLYGIVSAAMAYTHYLGILVIVAHGLWLALDSRKHVVPWVVTGMGVLAAYIPWLPSLWYQTISGHGWAWYRPHLTWQVLGDLTGLFAFGGSLFGMGDYFADTTLSPLEQLILLSPFIVLFAIGIAALWGSNNRYRSLVGSLLGVPIGVPLLISLLRPMFYPRWFSFLVPVYAIVMAAGIFHIAQSWKGRQSRVVVVISVGILVYSLPVLGRYYLDPASRLYDWRDASRLVEKNARPGDFFLYTNQAAETSFTYYFHGTYPSLTLTPIEAIPGPPRRPTFTSVQAGHLAARYPRLWIIATPPFTPAMQDRLRRDLEEAFQPVGQRDFGDVWVTLLRAKPASRSSPAPRE